MAKAVQILKNFFSSFGRLLNPEPTIAGLELSDSHLRLLYPQTGNVATASLRLAPGIIQDGKILNQGAFQTALTTLKRQLGISERKELYVIVSIPSPALYLQVFDLPYLAGAKLEEAAKLNLQIISPLPFENVYSDWETIGETEAAGGTIEILAAFSEKQNINNTVSVCKTAGFTVAAIEPAIVSVLRAIHEAAGIDTGPPALLLSVSQEGMDFAGIKNHKVFFNYFVSWRSLYGEAKEIAINVFQDTVLKHIRQVLNFSVGHTGTSITNLYLVTSALAEELKTMITKNLELKVVLVSFTAFRNLNPSWAAAIGAYRRGLLPRSQDTVISLTSVGTEGEFKLSQTMAFIRLWRNIAATFAAFLIIVFLAADIFIGRRLNAARSQTPPAITQQEISELSRLRSAAEEFNQLTQLISGVRQGKIFLQPFFEKIHQAARLKVSVNRIFFQSFSAPVLVSGEANSEQAVIDFKNTLEKDPSFKNIQLPITSLVPISAGRVAFSINLDFIPPKVE